MSFLTKIKFTTWMGIISIIGFGVILMNSLTGKDLSLWADSLLFLIIGIALFISGGAKFFVYFKGGLTNAEINRMASVLVGVASMITGVLIAPFFNYNFEVFAGFKTIISIFAISVIIVEIIQTQKGK